MKPFLIPVLLALIVSVAHAQDAKPLSLKQVPLRADAPVLFAPRGWMIEKRTNGDLNRDKLADAALVLVENKTAGDDEDGAPTRQRALVVLLREGKGWRRAGFNGSILLGTHDGGAFYGVVETPVDVQIKKGILLINLESGSRDILDTTHKFRFDAKRGAFLFIGFDSVDHDRLSTDVTTISTNFLTGVRKTTVLTGDDDKGKTKIARVSKKLRTLESVKGDERYAN